MLKASEPPACHLLVIGSSTGLLSPAAQLITDIPILETEEGTIGRDEKTEMNMDICMRTHCVEKQQVHTS